MSDAMPDIDAIQHEAKKTFNLKDRLTGANAKKSKILLYTDLQAVEDYNLAEAKKNITENQLSNNKLDLSAEVRQSVEDENTKATTESEEAKERMLAGALGVWLVGLPRVAVDVVARKARDKAKAEDGTLDPGIMNTEMDKGMLQRAIYKITTPEGEETTDVDIEDLYELLASTEWDRLVKKYSELQYESSIGQAATDEAGF